MGYRTGVNSNRLTLFTQSRRGNELRFRSDDIHNPSKELIQGLPAEKWPDFYAKRQY
ncbi:MAG: hypothetical protein ABW139_11275 [Candidatus Thiodiazotropha sp. DIVDIV]